MCRCRRLRSFLLGGGVQQSHRRLAPGVLVSLLQGGRRRLDAGGQLRTGLPRWHNYFAYNELDEAADEIGGDLDFKWDIAKERNGVDWSGYSRLFLDGFETGDANCWDD